MFSSPHCGPIFIGMCIVDFVPLLFTSRPSLLVAPPLPSRQGQGAASSDAIHTCSHRRSFYGKYTAKHCYQQPAASTPFLTSHSGGGELHGADDQHPYADALAIVMLRNPYDWALAMHDNCW